MNISELQVEFAKTQSELLVEAYIQQYGLPTTKEALLLFATMFWIVGHKFSPESLI